MLDGALTWWNTHMKTVGIDAAYHTPWTELKKMMTIEYCPRNEVQKLEAELWKLTVKGTDIAGYTKRFQKLALLCSGMVPGEEKMIERYIWGLPEKIEGNVTSSRPTKLSVAIRMSHKLMDQIEVVKVYTAAAESSDKKGYARTLPLYDTCKFHHRHSPCPAPCENYKKVGHQARDCWTPTSVTCLDCGEEGHTRRYRPNVENQNGVGDA
ncbi:reverse transcriptase domain-containing protein [Tanacetum coccineum]